MHADCQLATTKFQLLLSCACFTAGQYVVNLVHMCLRTNIRGGRQFNMFMSENICTMVDLFDKAVAGGGKIITVERKSEGDNQT